MEKVLKVRLLNVIDLCPGSKLVTAEITRSVSTWFWSKEVKVEITFSYIEGTWIDSDNHAIDNLDFRYMLQECLVAREAERRIDRYISTL
jgi:hypothetical protein